MDTLNDSVQSRRDLVKSCRKIVVKAGTRLVIGREAIRRLVEGIAALRKAGHRVLLVTSGAVGMGMELANLTRRPKQLAQSCVDPAVFSVDALDHHGQLHAVLQAVTRMRNA